MPSYFFHQLILRQNKQSSIAASIAPNTCHFLQVQTEWQRAQLLLIMGARLFQSRSTAFNEQGLTLDSEHVKGVIIGFLHSRFDISPEKITAETTLRDVGLDSMAMLEVMLELEDVLGIKMKDLSIPPNPSMRDVIALVERNARLAS